MSPLTEPDLKFSLIRLFKEYILYVLVELWTTVLLTPLAHL